MVLKLVGRGGRAGGTEAGPLVTELRSQRSSARWGFLASPVSRLSLSVHIGGVSQKEPLTVSEAPSPSRPTSHSPQDPEPQPSALKGPTPVRAPGSLHGAPSSRVAEHQLGASRAGVPPGGGRGLEQTKPKGTQAREKAMPEPPIQVRTGGEVG